MNADDLWLLLYFKLRLYEADGAAFQRLAADVLQVRYPDFVPVRPSGPIGDHGNDGYVPGEAMFFQVYGPSACTDLSPRAAAKKARQDFAKLRSRYPDLRTYGFVLNDRFQGVPAAVLDELLAMQQETGVPCKVIAAGRLLDWFMALPQDRRKLIVQGVPFRLPDWVDPRAVGEILQHLADRTAPWRTARAISAEFDAKLRFNGLEGEAADWLRALSYQTYLIDEFLAARGSYLAQSVAEDMRDLYRQSVEAIPQTDPDAPALRYVWMAERLIPSDANAHPHSLKAYREAARVVLSKYFEACNVYEQPGMGGRPT